MCCVHIVDGDAGFRESLRALLSARPNLIIRCFASGDAFLADAADIDPGVLLLDLHLPGASGLDVLAAAREHAAIVLTGRGDVACAVEAMKAGAMDLLQKPFDPPRLLSLIDAGFARLERGAAGARRAQAARARITRLSPREGDVLRGLLDGRPNKAIASDLDLSPRTVELHRAKVMEKLAVGSIPEAMRVAFYAGMFAAD